jgi:hypothetical protein
MRRKKDPMIEQVLLDMVEPETAGDPMSEQKWVRRSLRALSEDLSQAGHDARCPFHKFIPSGVAARFRL